MHQAPATTMAENDFHFPLERRNSSGKLIRTIMVTPISSSPTTDQEHKVDYYASGNKELSTETALTVKRLEPRRKLTSNSTRLVIALVGLPARGKSFVSRKLQHYLNWSGVQCEIFNVGKYRRAAYAKEQEEKATTEREKQGACDANFFDGNNRQAAELREKVAETALLEMLRWLDGESSTCDMDTSQQLHDSDGECDNSSSNHHHHNNSGSTADLSRHSTYSTVSGSGSVNSKAPPGTAKLNFHTAERVAIFDATNSTNKRRQWLLEMCTSPERRGDKKTGVVFVESICDDQELLDENYRYKVSSSPDFEHMDLEEAMEDLRRRVTKYEEQYETITDDSQSYIKIFNLSTKLMVNHIYGRMAKDLVPALMAWHIGTRPVFLCRPGQTISGILTDGEDYVNRDKINIADPRFRDMSRHSKRQNLRGDTLGPTGKQFRQDLLEFCAEESRHFMAKRASVRDMSHTGTSISGLAPGPSQQFTMGDDDDVHFDNEGDHPHHRHQDSICREPFPLCISTSTMPRAVDTVNWDEFSIKQKSALNPLDKGDYAGMELDEIKKVNPEWYEKLEQDPFRTRFPGGESYKDLMSRLTSVVIDIEQQVIPTLVVSHVSILQCLMAYFRNTRVEKCMSLEVPLHTVIKFTPVRGGGWSESHHPMYDVPELPTMIRRDSTPKSPGGRMKSVESMGELSQGEHSLGSVNAPVSPAPIWGDGMPTPHSPVVYKHVSLPT